MKKTKEEIRKEYLGRINPWNKESMDLQEIGAYCGEEHWDNFLQEEKRHEYLNGFQHGYKHGFEQALKDVVSYNEEKYKLSKRAVI